MIVGDDWTGATRSPAYDFDLQFWLAPVHCLWLYHAARVSGGSGDGSGGSSETVSPARRYLNLEDEWETAEVASQQARTTRAPALSLAAAFLCGGPMMHLGELSYGIYICQLGGIGTVAWYHNLGDIGVLKPANWLNHDAANWGLFALEWWNLAEVLLVLCGAAQLFEMGLARAKW